MKKELQEKLYTKYPKIFTQKDLPLDQTSMCWGISTGDGWYWLIESLCARIQCLCDNQKISQVEATQVKEKFGGLRFYYSGGNDEISNIVWFAETLSTRICEECGSTKDVELTRGGWIRALCKVCKQKS